MLERDTNIPGSLFPAPQCCLELGHAGDYWEKGCGQPCNGRSIPAEPSLGCPAGPGPATAGADRAKPGKGTGAQLPPASVQGGSPGPPKTFSTSLEQMTSPSWWGTVTPLPSSQTAARRVKVVTGDVLRVGLQPSPAQHAAQEQHRLGGCCHNMRGRSPELSPSRWPRAGLTTAVPWASAPQPCSQTCLSFILCASSFPHPFLILSSERKKNDLSFPFSPVFGMW